MSTDFLTRLGAGLKAERKKAGLTQAVVGQALGLKPPGGHGYVSCLEAGKMGNVGIETVVRYLQICKAPIGKFMLELALSGAFGEAEAEYVRGFTAQQRSPQAPHHRGFATDDGRSGAARACLPVTPLGRTQGETSNEQAKRAKAKLLRDKRWLREAQDADIIAKLWREVLPAIEPLLPADDPTRRFLAPYLEGVRALYRAWKQAVRGAVDKDSVPDVRMAFDRIEQAGLQRLVPAAVLKMREIVFTRLMEMTAR